MQQYRVPVLEIGGTHVTAALVSSGCEIVSGSPTRLPLHAAAAADDLLDAMAQAARTLGVDHRLEWVVAIPGPFDYAQGVGRFADVGKFDCLYGVDVREGLSKRIRPTPSLVLFVNDADAFGVGEYAVGAARGHERAVCITLGTGVGSAFLDRGEPVYTGSEVPPKGWAHLLSYSGRPLEETVSRRAIRTSYARLSGTVGGDRVADVATIAERGRCGDAAAAQVLQSAFSALGSALGPAVERFQASILVIGGSIAQSWDFLAPSLRRGLVDAAPSLQSLAIQPAARPDDAALIGAGYWATRHGERVAEWQERHQPLRSQPAIQTQEGPGCGA